MIYVTIKRNVLDNVIHVKISCVLSALKIIIKPILVHVLNVDILWKNIVGRISISKEPQEFEVLC